MITRTEKMELFGSKFFKSDSPIKKVLIEVLYVVRSNSSPFVLIPLSEINGPWWLTKYTS